MNDQSPPKRVTRARAAAKTNDAGVKTTKIATAATKAKIVRAVPTTKRKTRADDTPEEDTPQALAHTIDSEPTKTTRGRSKKPAAPTEPAMEEQAPVLARATRGRAKMPTIEIPAFEPIRSLRGRAKKADFSSEEPTIEEPPKRVARTRTSAVMKTVPPKKTVKFEEPDKENIVPVPATKAKAKAVETGLRAKPIRKPTTNTTRATRGRAKPAAEEKAQKSSPLSPKKATQLARSTSEDELATTEKTPMKPLMKSPVKPSGRIFNTAKKLDFSSTIGTTRSITSTALDFGTSAIGSPARRPPQSPFKDSLKISPQKGSLGDSIPRSPFKISLPASQSRAAGSSIKTPMLQSPARRPQSPIKVSETGSPVRARTTQLDVAATPKVGTLKMTKFATPKTINRSIIRPRKMVVESDSPKSAADQGLSLEESLTFTGRLSSIVPRDVDPAFAMTDLITENSEALVEVAKMTEEPVAIDFSNNTVVEEAPIVEATTPPTSPSKFCIGTHNREEVDENPFEDSDSEDELTSDAPKYAFHQFGGFRSTSQDLESEPSTPIAFTAISKTPRTAKTFDYTIQQASGIKAVGFTPLATQLSSWMAESTEDKFAEEANILHTGPLTPTRLSNLEVPQISPVKSTFFDDEMSVRDELASDPESEPEQEVLDPEFNQIDVDDEDLALADEADELSALEPEDIEAIQAMEDEYEAAETAPSEASQEYGDENYMPIDPALLTLVPLQALSTPFERTPKRVLAERVCHTVSKVPLKAAADDTPMRPSPQKRAASISRLSTQRPSSALKRNSTVISYSSQKSTPRPYQQLQLGEVVLEDACSTPTKEQQALWSNLGTPPRTPRRDVNTALLKGAIVYVDVHTTEGADASVLFTELLCQMGARCVKAWTWNGNGEDGSKIGITHVVFKDGGKRTLGKVRETDGIVACVGVGWVLDCERENKWLDEALYAVDTAIAPRGGRRRRKSMEPRALANLNGTLVPISSTTPARDSNMSPTKEFLNLDTPMTSKSKRRASVQWVRSPTVTLSPNDDDTSEESFMLSPLPATPTPETISAYGENGLYGDETPASQTPYFLHNAELVQKTAPAKGRLFGNEGGNVSFSGSGFLTLKKDESVMMRLMAARRKSLQFAPKVGSPLRGAPW